MHKNTYLLIILALLAIAGCSDSSRPVATGKGTIRAINSAVTAPSVAFRLEERTLASTEFKDVTASSEFDDLNYTVNFDYLFLGESDPSRLASVPFDLVRDNDYLFIFTGSLANPDAIVWERPIREWDGTEDLVEVAFGHLAPQFGNLDFYFDAPGTVPVAGQDIARLRNGNRSNVLELAAGEYALTVTTAGDPADILYTSVDVDLPPRANFLFAVFDVDRSYNGDFSVRLITSAGSSTELGDVDVRPSFRVFHTAQGTVPLDVYLDDDFTMPLVANTDFGELSAAEDTASGTSTYTYTEAGNVGAILLERDLPIVNLQQNTTFVTGDPASLTVLQTVDDLRSEEDHAKLRLIQTSVNQDPVDIFLVEQGTDIDDALPSFFSVPSNGNTGYRNFAGDSYELYITTEGTTDVVGGPVALDLAVGDAVHVAVIDTVDPNVVDIVVYDQVSFPP